MSLMVIIPIFTALAFGAGANGNERGQRAERLFLMPVHVLHEVADDRGNTASIYTSADALL